MDYEQLLTSWWCRNCYEGALSDWEDDIPLFCIETIEYTLDIEGTDLQQRVCYYRVWCQACVPGYLQIHN